MNGNGWLAGVVGVAGLVLIAMVTVVLRAVNQSRRARPGYGPTAESEPPTAVAYAARGLGHMFGAVNAPRRPRSVESNLQRAFARIDAIDPYAGPRRIGMALTDKGLLSPEAASTEPTATDQGRSSDVWPVDTRRHQRARREDEE